MAVELGDVGLKQLFVPAIMGIAAYFKQYLGLSPRLVPVLVVALSVIAQCLVNQEANLITVLQGLGWGFGSVGLYSAVKNTVEKRG